MAAPVVAGRVHRPVLLAVVLCSTQFLNIVNLSSVSIALPDIAADLDLSEANLPWVISAYALTFAGFLLVGGRAADLMGRRRVLVFGFAVFAAFELVAALAPGAGVLIAARGLQGIGAATMIPASLGILTDAFAEPAERSRALAAFGVGGRRRVRGGPAPRRGRHRRPGLALGVRPHGGADGGPDRPDLRPRAARPRPGPCRGPPRPPRRPDRHGRAARADLRPDQRTAGPGGARPPPCSRWSAAWPCCSSSSPCRPGRRTR